MSLEMQRALMYSLTYSVGGNNFSSSFATTGYAAAFLGAAELGPARGFNGLVASGL